MVRRILYRFLPLETYLQVLSKIYFISFDLGLLKKNRVYDYPYFLKKIVKQGDVCIDIGANLGYLTVLFSRLVGSKGKVHAVEPVIPVRSVLTKNTRHLENVRIYPYALGQENKSIKLGNDSIQEKGYLASGSHFVLPESSHAKVEFEAEMRKGSEVFADLERLDFIKCDIEGYEAIVLRELEPIITKFQPTILVESRGPNRQELREYFRSLQYNSYILESEKLISAEQDDYWDILLVHHSKMDSVAPYIVKAK